MKENYSDLPTYLLIKRYRAEKDKQSPDAIELEKLIRDDLKFSGDVDLASIEIQEKLSKIVLNDKKKNEKFINVTAWIYIVLTGLGFTGSGCSLVTIDFTSTLSKILAPPYVKDINPIVRFFIENQVLFTVISTIFLLATFIVSIGVLYRSNLARKLAVIFLGLKIIQNISEPLLVKYVYPSIYDLNIDVPKSLADSMHQSSVIMSMFFSIIFIFLYTWLIYKFTSPEIKEEFS